MPPVPQLPSRRGKRVLALRAFYAGTADEAERLLAPLFEAAGPPLIDGMRETSFADAAAMLRRRRRRSPSALDLFRELPDAVIDAVVEADDAVAGVEVRHWGGEMARPGDDAGPVGHRHVPFSVVVGGQADDAGGGGADDGRGAGRRGQARPHSTGGSFLNFLGDPARTADAYTDDDYRRLREVKAAYDPDNVFGANHNIPPA